MKLDVKTTQEKDLALPMPLKISVSKSSPEPEQMNQTPIIDSKYKANSEVIHEDNESQESYNLSDQEEAQEYCALTDDILRSHMGYGQLGVLPLPTRHDEYEHMSVNFRGEKMNQAVEDVSLIVFGGINFKNEGSRETFHLEIDMNHYTYTLSYMPEARLRCSDQFMDNQALHVYDELNVVTMLGKRGVYKINLKSPIGKL